MMVPVTTTGSLRILRNDRSGRRSSSPRSVTPPTGDAPRFDQASAPAAAAALEAGLASSHRAGARARRLGADGDRGYAPRLRLTPASTGLKLVILWLVTFVVVQPSEAATPSGAETIGRLSVARWRPTALSRGDGFDVRASGHGLLARGRHMSHDWATRQQDFEPKSSSQHPVEPERVLDHHGADRGKGTKRCDACNRGTVACQACAGVGALDAWLVVDRTSFSQARAHPSTGAAAVHDGLTDPANFDSPASWRARLVDDSGPCQSLPGLPPELTPEVDARFDRVASSRTQALEASFHRFDISACGLHGSVSVAGSPPSIHPSSRWMPLAVRLVTMVGVGFALLTFVFALVHNYLSQHEWYAHNGHSGELLAVGWLFFAAFTVAFGGFLMPRRGWSLLRNAVPTGLAVFSGIGMAWLYSLPRPSAQAAQAAYNAGDMGRASLEAKALRDLRIDEAVGSEILDGLHFQRVQKATTFDARMVAVEEAWHSGLARARAVSWLLTDAQKREADFVAQRDARGLAALGDSLGRLDPKLGSQVAARGTLIEASQCVATNDCGCVRDKLGSVRGKLDRAEIDAVSNTALSAMSKKVVEELASSRTENDPRRRERSFTSAIRLAECVQQVAEESGLPRPFEKEVSKARAEVDRVNVIIDRIDAAERARLKAQEAAEARAEAARDRADREASRGLVCGDGTLSPTCLCHGNHRGCCSHHGGIAGCEPLD